MTVGRGASPIGCNRPATCPPCLTCCPSTPCAGLQSEHEQQDELQIELDRVSAQQAALPGLISEVRVALAAETVKAERQAAALADQDSAKQRKLGALQQALQMYRDRLGLVFEQAAEEQLVLVFTHVDARDPARRFEFAVQVLEDDSYQGEHPLAPPVALRVGPDVAECCTLVHS